jgi:hypothetical protein
LEDGNVPRSVACTPIIFIVNFVSSSANPFDSMIGMTFTALPLSRRGSIIHVNIAFAIGIAVKNPHLGIQHNDLMSYFSIPMNQHTFAKFVSVYLNMHPSVRETLIRTCGSTLEQEYEKIHGKPEPLQGKSAPSK